MKGHKIKTQSYPKVQLAEMQRCAGKCVEEGHECEEVSNPNGRGIFHIFDCIPAEVL